MLQLLSASLFSFHLLVERRKTKSTFGIDWVLDMESETLRVSSEERLVPGNDATAYKTVGQALAVNLRKVGRALPVPVALIRQINSACSARRE
jgi:hypothetical protein